MLEVKTTGTDEYIDYLRLVIAGPPGSAKTSIAAQAPDVLFLAANANLTTVADKGLSYIPIESTQQLAEAKHLLSQPDKFLKENLGFVPKTVVIDSIDEVSRIVSDERLQDTRQDIFKGGDWTWFSNQMKIITRSFMSLDMHVIFIVRTTAKFDHDSEETAVSLDISGAAENQLLSDSLVNLLVGVKYDTVKPESEEDAVIERTVKRFITSVPSVSAPWIKDSSCRIPDYLEVDFETDFDRIFSAIFDEPPELPESTTKEIEVPIEPQKTVVSPRNPQTTAKATKTMTLTSQEDDKPSTEEVQDKLQEAAKTVEAASPESSSGVDNRPGFRLPVNNSEKGPQKVAVDGEPVIGQNRWQYGKIISRNELPKDVKPINKKFNTDLYCEISGHELENQDLADFGKIRFRKFVCQEVFNDLKNERKQK